MGSRPVLLFGFSFHSRYFLRYLLLLPFLFARSDAVARPTFWVIFVTPLFFSRHVNPFASNSFAPIPVFLFRYPLVSISMISDPFFHIGRGSF